MDTPPEEPEHLRFLRRLVTALTATMILGIGAIVVLLFIRLNAGTPALKLPDSVTLPDGTAATAFTQGSDWWAIVTEDDRILIYDRSSGEIRQEVEIKR